MIWGKINSSHVKRKGFSLKSKELTNVILELGILYCLLVFHFQENEMKVRLSQLDKQDQ